MYNVTADFPHSNIFSNRLCLGVQDTHSMTFRVNKLVYVSLTSEECESVSASAYNQTVSQNSVLGHSYMFYWLNGTSLSFRAEVNGSSVMSVFLMQNKRSFDLCMNHFTPEDYLKAWVFNISNCNVVASTGLMACDFRYDVKVSGYYYVCVNSTIEYNLQYNISMSALVYNTSRSRMAVQCTSSEECCLPFEDVFTELYRPTCMFVITTPLSPSFTGIRLTDILHVRVDQRLSVIWYCIAAFFPLLLVLVCILLLCKLTSRRAKDSNVSDRGCVLYCNVYSNSTKYNNSL